MIFREAEKFRRFGLMMGQFALSFDWLDRPNSESLSAKGDSRGRWQQSTLRPRESRGPPHSSCELEISLPEQTRLSFGD